MKRGRDGYPRDAAKNGRRDGQKSFYSLKEALDSGKTEIFHAMRLARGFERQKMGRRQKDAKENNSAEDIARIDNEIVVLKGFDLAAMAEFYLYKTLLRIPSISTAPQFPASIVQTVTEATKPMDSTYLNVSARLFKSNAVSTALENSLKGIYEVIGVEPQMGRKKRLRKGDFKPTSSATSEQPQPFSHRESQDERNASVMSAEPEAMPTQVLQAKTKPSNVNDDHQSGTDSSSDSPSSDALDSSAELIAKVPEEDSDDTENDEPNAARKPLTTTAFLPSLAGGYISGSESEATDVDEPRPKNRPGQRARQALWEKKYGKSAAHLQKQRQSRDYGWDARKGAQESSARGKHKAKGKPDFPPKQGGKHQDYNAQTKSNSQADGKRAPKEHQGSREKPVSLHPSWEAARKQKQQTTAAAFQGKKVVFD